MYLAFQSVHNPYEDPINSGIPRTDVNETYPEIVDQTRRIYAGMVSLTCDLRLFVMSKPFSDRLLVVAGDCAGPGCEGGRTGVQGRGSVGGNHHDLLN